ncbi:MAG: hypothetical protein LBL00_02640 [Endomicrobium sp.]|jgi:hypothetical protein|nr:hypothetical protein [Endomicrobium sp.]
MNYNKRVFAAAVFAIFGIVGLISCGQSDKSVDNTLAQIALEANKDLPVMIDAQTRLDSITTLPGKKIQYNNTLLNTINAEINTETFKESASRTLLSAVKSNPSLESYRRKKVTFIYRYQNEAGEEMAVFEYTPEDYK